LFSGQYIKKVRPISESVPPISHKRQSNIHMKGQFEMKLKFFFVSQSVSVPLNKQLLYNIFCCPFSVTFGKIRPQILPTNFFPPAPFELFGRNFGHLETLVNTTTPGQVSVEATSLYPYDIVILYHNLLVSIFPFFPSLFPMNAGNFEQH
jgi:hypothetical protein